MSVLPPLGTREDAGGERDRPALVEIQELMAYKQFFDIERRFLGADQLTRKYGTEQGAS